MQRTLTEMENVPGVSANGVQKRVFSMLKAVRRRILVALCALSLPVTAGLAGLSILPAVVLAQTAPAHQVGTVTSVTGRTIVLKSTAGAETSITVDANAKVLSLPPGSKNLAAASAATLADVAVGDRVLATGTAATAGTFSASRIILMKAGDIAAMHASQQADWQKNGVSGLVRAVDGAALTVASGGHTIQVETSPQTVFKRYAAGSVSFREAKPSTLAEIHTGDQLSVRGQKSADGTKVSADEIVAGTFENLSGAIASINADAQTLTLKDLVTKKTVTVAVTPESDLRSLPAEAAHAIAARTERAGGAAKAGGELGRPGATAAPGGNARTAGGQAEGAEGQSRRAGMDLSRMLPRLPQQKLGDLKVGDAVMIVASQSNGQDPLTAITMLSGVEPLLAAKSAGSKPITLSPWDLDAPGGGL